MDPYLASLKAQDPELFRILEENDQYDRVPYDQESSSDNDGAENDDFDPVHKLPYNLEVASDDTGDYDDDDDDQKWKEGMFKKISINVIYIENSKQRTILWPIIYYVLYL